MTWVARSLAVSVLVAVAASGCGSGGERAGTPASGPSAPTEVADTAPPVDADASSPSLSDATVELGSAVYDPSEHATESVAPVALGIDALAVRGAPVSPVGVDGAGELAVPGASDVGWYRYGPRPGAPGVAVLAAHIAFDGVDGVFRHLADLRPGDAVTVKLSDGTVQAWRVTELTQHPKSELPPELWVRDGSPRLALVTCGGSFDSARRSYEDNVVAWAEPA